MNSAPAEPETFIHRDGRTLRRDSSLPIRDRFESTSTAIWDHAKQQLCCLQCTRWTPIRDLPLHVKTMGRIACVHCGTALQL